MPSKDEIIAAHQQEIERLEQALVHARRGTAALRDENLKLHARITKLETLINNFATEALKDMELDTSIRITAIDAEDILNSIITINPASESPFDPHSSDLG